MGPIEQDLTLLGAPAKVQEAGKLCDRSKQAGLSPSGELVQFIREWVTTNRGNNRYGK